MRTVVALLALAGAALVLLAPPASADPARPTNVSSVITGITPPTALVRAEVKGGGSFIVVRVARGASVTVLGYEQEPYLRIGPDGAVEENTRSPATYLNRSRYASTPVPSSASAAAVPQWKRVGSGGSYAWHDHRTHWMATGRPPRPVNWQVPLVVNGTPVTINGIYRGVPAPSSTPWWVLLGAVFLAVLAVGLARLRWGAVGAVLAAGAALPVAYAVARLPASGVGDWAGFVLGAVALAAGLAAAVLARRKRAVAGSLLAGAGVALLVWAGRRLAVFDNAVLVTDLPAWTDRFGVALSVGAGLAAVVLGVRAVLA